MNFLEVSKDYAKLTDPDRADGYDAPISAIQSLMSVLTFGLLLSFAGVGIKTAYVAARSTSLSDIRTRVQSVFGRSHGDSEAPQLAGVENVDEENFAGSNPMRSAGGAATERTSKTARRDLAVEMTSFKATKLAQRGGRQLSVESSETMALPAPPAVVTFSPAASALPAVWIAHTAPSGEVYYYNASTGLTSWTLPAAESFEVGS